MSARSNRIDGLEESLDFFDAIPVAARHATADLLGKVGRDVLAAQKRDVAKDTGKLEAGLSLQLLLEELRVRVGLLGVKAGRSSLFYGRIIEFGRSAQVVPRRRPGLKGRSRKAQGRRAALGSSLTKPMKVKAMAPRPFVHKDRPEIRAEQRLADFWAQVLGNAETKA